MRWGILAVLAVLGCSENAPPPAYDAPAPSADTPTIIDPAPATRGPTLDEALADFRATVMAAEHHREADLVVAAGGRETDAYEWRVLEEQTRRADFDGDGDEDVVVLANLCETESCHSTTNVAYIALIENNGAEFHSSASRRFGGSSQLGAYRDGGIEVSTLQFGPNDPQCCPSERVTEIISLTGGR